METDLNRILFSHSGSSNEICVPAGSKWKFKLGFRDSSSRGSYDSESDLTTAQNTTREGFSRLLEASKEDIISLWQDEDVQKALAERDIHLRDTPGL